MSAKQGKAKDPVHYVHQSAILCETIKKELRHQQLFTKYTINQFTKQQVITGKPNSYCDAAEGKPDETFLKIIRRAALEPYRKYPYPLTEGQEYGWNHDPLIDKNESVLHFPKKHTDITNYGNAAHRK